MNMLSGRMEDCFFLKRIEMSEILKVEDVLELVYEMKKQDEKIFPIQSTFEVTYYERRNSWEKVIDFLNDIEKERIC